jgi:hypothetical protein
MGGGWKGVRDRGTCLYQPSVASVDLVTDRRPPKKSILAYSSTIAIVAIRLKTKKCRNSCYALQDSDSDDFLEGIRREETSVSVNS